MKEGVALSQLADILPPPVPEGPDWMLLGMIGFVCLVAVVTLLLFVKWRHSRQDTSPAREAQRRLTALRNAWQARTLSDREAAYRLAALLRLGLALPQLSMQQNPHAVEDETSWSEILQRLYALRYRDQSGISLSSQCFECAEHWLANAQRQAR